MQSSDSTNPEGAGTTESNTPPAARRRLGLALIGLALTVGGPLLYMSLMYHPWIRSTGAPAFVLMAVGAIFGLFAVFEDRRLLVRGVGALSPLLTILFTYIFFWGLILPPSPELDALSVAPSFVLPDQDGKQVSLEEVTAAGPALLVFYRGYW